MPRSAATAAMASDSNHFPDNIKSFTAASAELSAISVSLSANDALRGACGGRLKSKRSSKSPMCGTIAADSGYPDRISPTNSDLSPLSNASSASSQTLLRGSSSNRDQSGRAMMFVAVCFEPVRRAVGLLRCRHASASNATTSRPCRVRATCRDDLRTTPSTRSVRAKSATDYKPRARQPADAPATAR